MNVGEVLSEVVEGGNGQTGKAGSPFQGRHVRQATGLLSYILNSWNFFNFGLKKSGLTLEFTFTYLGIYQKLMTINKESQGERIYHDQIGAVPQSIVIR